MAGSSLERRLLTLLLAGGLAWAVGCRTTAEKADEATQPATDQGATPDAGVVMPGTGGAGMEEPLHGEPERQPPTGAEEGTGGAGAATPEPVDEPGGTGEPPDTPVNPDERAR
ncbi:MAG: hypothetical protein L0Y66_26110 [Myxococcaceae bacterium]|nr:hypothetical protein [Myxococcaceae bacterium]MCI0671166.1 hypothetical protein [Myxococcaceae bacterium]